MKPNVRMFMFVLFAFTIMAMPSGLSAVDWEKHHKNKREDLKLALDELSQKGSVKASKPFRKPYDKNKDGMIDRGEAGEIRAYLNSRISR